MGSRMEKIFPQIDSFSLLTKSISFLSTLLYLLNFSKLKVLEPMELNYSVAILTNYSDKGQDLRMV